MPEGHCQLGQHIEHIVLHEEALERKKAILAKKEEIHAVMEDPELDLESREKAVRHLAGLEADMKEVGRDLVSLSDRHGSMEKVP